MRRIQPAQMDMTVNLASAIPTGNVGDIVNFNVAGDSRIVNFIAVGQVLAIDLENFYVLSVQQTTAGVTCMRGYQGSHPAAHTAMTSTTGGSLVYINPKFTRFDVATAINEELYDLSAPTNGLYNLNTIDITYNPVFMGYDMTNVDPLIIDVVGCRYKIAPPTHNWPRIDRWAVFPQMTDAIFPSGFALIVYSPAWPGLPIHVWYKTSFFPLINLTDNVVNTTGMAPTALDILPVGAAILLNQDREIKRNFTEAQPDARKAAEVPPAAVMNATKQMQLWRGNRIAAERARLEQNVRWIRVKP
jgi:hypothetical protein